MSTSGPPDHVAGALVGLAAGDALGAGYEFGPPLSHDPEMKGGGKWEPGEWTDDTSMAVCIAEVTALGPPEPTEIGDWFLKWYRSRPKDVGIQTSAVLSEAKTGEDLQRLASDYFTQHPKGAAGNGSLMRTAPIALAHLEDDQAIWESAQTISALTHGDPLAGEACALWCIAIDRAISEARLDGVRDGLDYLASDSRDRWEGWIEEAETMPPGSFAPNGFVVPAFQAAYASIFQTSIPEEMPCLHFQDALNVAVRIGDDTDTVAAIAGSLLGARWGVSALPFGWRRLIHGWPGYRTRDLVRLAICTANNRGAGSTDWPRAGSLMERYERWQPRGVAKSLEDDPGVLVGDVKGLKGAGGKADIIVSLCQMGTEDVPASAEHHEVWLIDQEGANPNLDFILSDTAREIIAARDGGRTVFIHCVRAESRTTTVAAAYLAHRLGTHGEEALAKVRGVLPDSSPGPWFREALERLWPKEE